MKENSLSSWLQQNSCFLYKDDKRKYTHLCLDGGRLCVPQNLHEEFIRVYSEGIDNKERYYVCEVPTEVCRMYCDLDIIEEEVFPLEKIQEIVKVISSIVKFYYDKEFNIIVCTTTPKNVTRDKTKMIKTGVHLIWENLFVSRKNALNLSKQFILALIGKFGERPDYNKWDDVVDEHVYSENSASLRMVGSGKATKKKKTNKETNETELVLVDEKRVYMPVWCYGESCSFLDNRDKIKKCTIRVFESETEWIDSIPQFIPQVKSKKSKEGDTVFSEDPIFQKVEKFIRSIIPEWDRPMRFLKKQGKFYSVKLDGAMFCLNKNGEHNSCGIFFQILEDGLVQRCFCRCKTTEGRSHGLCSEFKSKYFNLPFELKTLLFPKKKKRKNIKKDSYGLSGAPSVFGSYTSLKQSKQSYLKMSMNSILFIENKIKELDNNNFF
jgi:hypothetical protein